MNGKMFVGTVVKTSGNLARVKVERYPLLHSHCKRVFTLRSFDCYNGGSAGEGDLVRIEYMGTLAPDLRFKITDILDAAEAVDTPALGQHARRLAPRLLLGPLDICAPKNVYVPTDIPPPPRRVNGNRQRKHAYAVGCALENFGKL